ncbi:type II toxin-antitoxin system RelE/ParE family toxin [Nocardioides immobilis]|uniref:Type II toxin-antitoxin system RelE/ParE family toxin n=1 Tax=Nocardioides immobilis TaxID=2049295 RepID=A0A417Y1F5_9ACTN|nr:type II toxin-antitoxin system RelE/ParE family toxin [Nocardioides immobilis]RHW26374.1 type II toxin-antitoxin system RelE/ParE family toxin [Nocardioides immobilis]
MSLPQREHPEAAAEFDAALRWYEDREKGLGLALLDRAEASRADISAWPEAAPAFPGWTGDETVRCVLVKGYPYRIAYLLRETEIVILAYAHQNRRPGYWADRVPTA